MRSASRRNEAAMTKKLFWISVVLALLAAVSARSVHAQDWDRSTHVTFNQPIDVSGQVIPPGSYWFTLADVNGRHIVRIFNDDWKNVVLAVMTIPDYRLVTTSEAVFEFYEVPAGSPKALRAWFYPYDSAGEEFFHPTQRALAPAKAPNAPVALASAVRTTAPAREPVVTVANYTELPKTASWLPGVLFVGLGFLILGLALKVIVTRM
jgi:hypothetical protein